MTRVLCWKVYREQWALWVAVAIMAVGIRVAVMILAGEQGTQCLGFAFCAIAHVYGLVVGALLLAEERERGTAAFLESLPASGVAVWWAKAKAGCLVVLTQVMVFWSLTPADGFWGHEQGAGSGLAILAGAAFAGFAWGLLLSARTRTVLGAVGTAAAVEVGAGLVMIALGPGMMNYLPIGQRLAGEERAWVPVGSGLLLLVGPLLASLLCQAGGDNKRRPVVARCLANVAHPAAAARPRAVFGLELRPSRWGFQWLVLGALAGGLLLPFRDRDWAAGWPFVLGWPLLSLLAGVSAGVSAFGGAQASETRRLLQE